MIAPVFLGLLSISISLVLNSVRPIFIKVFAALFPIFVFLALRYNYGNDYPGYFRLFGEIAELDAFGYEYDVGDYEVGWVFLNKCFSEVGFFWMVAFLAALQIYVLGRFLVKYVPERYYWLAIFLYIFVPENMLIQASAMRQAVAMLLFFFAVDFLIQGRRLIYFAFIFAASLFHTSALVLLPVYFLKHINSIGRWGGAVFLGVYFLIFVFADSVAYFLQNILLASDAGAVFERYKIYEDKGGLGSGVGLLVNGAYLWILLWLHDRQSEAGRVLFKIVCCGLLLLPLAVEISMVSRLIFYFGIFSVATVPLIVSQIKDNVLRIVFCSAYMLYVGFVFFMFFQAPVWRDAFGQYSTIIF